MMNQNEWAMQQQWQAQAQAQQQQQLMNERVRPISGAWRVMYALTFVGMTLMLVLNWVFAQMAGREMLDCMRSTRNLPYSSSTYGLCDHSPSKTMASLTSTGATLAMIGLFIFAAVWVGAAWGALPASQRKVGSRAISAGGAAFGVLLPLFNIYAMFALPLSISRALNHHAAQLGLAHRSRYGIALVAAIMTLIPPLTLLAPLVWVAYMSTTDSTARAISQAPQVAPGWNPSMHPA